jgi:hypothetical protein
MPPAPGAAGQASGAMRAASSAVESSPTSPSSQTGAPSNRTVPTGNPPRPLTVSARRTTAGARPMPATMLPVYDMLTEEASPMPRIEISHEDAADIARLCYLLEPGVVLTRAEVVHQILVEWRQAKLAKVAKVAKTP